MRCEHCGQVPPRPPARCCAKAWEEDTDHTTALSIEIEELRTRVTALEELVGHMQRSLLALDARTVSQVRLGPGQASAMWDTRDLVKAVESLKDGLEKD